MAADWTELSIAFAGGSLMATVISAFVKHCVFHPVISVRLDEKGGSYGAIPFIDKATGAHDHDARYLRLHVENTGLSSIKDCCGQITKITKRIRGTRSPAQLDVVDLGWVNAGTFTRDIPRGAFFHMDVVTLHLRPTRNELQIPQGMPSHLVPFIADKATYEFEIRIAADNARPRRCIPVEFDYDPNSNELRVEWVNKVRYPWWKFWRWPGAFVRLIVSVVGLVRRTY